MTGLDTRRVGDAVTDWHPEPSGPKPLAGRTAVVVGASRGIGALVAEVLLVDGARVVIAGRDGAALNARVDELRAACPQGEVDGVECDVVDEADVEALFAGAATPSGTLDIVVVAAGVTGPIETPVAGVAVADFRQVLDINVTGTFLCCRAAEQYLRGASAGGRIVTIGSTAGMRGMPNRVAYSTSKWALRGLTRTLARELGPAGITVNTVVPFTVHGTRMADVVEGKARRHGLDPQAVYDDFAKQTALGRWIDESDVAQTIRFLVSDSARSITGQDIAVDAGWDA